MKFGFQSNKRIGYQLVKTGSLLDNYSQRCVEILVICATIPFFKVKSLKELSYGAWLEWYIYVNFI